MMLHGRGCDVSSQAVAVASRRRVGSGIAAGRRNHGLPRDAAAT